MGAVRRKRPGRGVGREFGGVRGDGWLEEIIDSYSWVFNTALI
jgi:hypothetical protein